MVYLRPASEMDLHGALTGYLQRKGLELEDLFAVLDTDLDGALEVEQMRGLLGEVMPQLTTTEAQYFLVGAAWCRV